MPHHATVVKYYNHSFCNSSGIKTLDGDLVCVTSVGGVDLPGLNAELTEDEIKLYMCFVFDLRLHMLEQIFEQGKKEAGGERLGVRLPHFVDVHCLRCPRGFLSTFAWTGMTFFKVWMTEVAPSYPEQCSRVVLVRTPWIFHSTWSLVRDWMPKRTQVSETAIVVVVDDFVVVLLLCCCYSCSCSCSPAPPPSSHLLLPFPSPPAPNLTPARQRWTSSAMPPPFAWKVALRRLTCALG